MTPENRVQGAGLEFDDSQRVLSPVLFFTHVEPQIMDVFSFNYVLSF